MTFIISWLNFAACSFCLNAGCFRTFDTSLLFHVGSHIIVSISGAILNVLIKKNHSAYEHYDHDEQNQIHIAHYANG